MNKPEGLASWRQRFSGEVNLHALLTGSKEECMFSFFAIAAASGELSPAHRDGRGKPSGAFSLGKEII